MAKEKNVVIKVDAEELRRRREAAATRLGIKLEATCPVMDGLMLLLGDWMQTYTNVRATFVVEQIFQLAEADRAAGSFARQWRGVAVAHAGLANVEGRQQLSLLIEPR